MIKKLLIANRGEIARRIIRTCRRLGIATVAVYSTADRKSLHVSEADEAFWIGESESRSSYLNIERIVDAALHSHADAVHPGYGFLAENAAFVDRLVEAKLVFVGPPASAMRALGDKLGAKALAAKAGVPALPSRSLTADPLEDARSFAAEQGYPIIIKATGGGGGRGMRKVFAGKDLEAAIQSAMREALASFNDPRLFVERLVTQGRHIEVQIFGDLYGNVIHLYDRDCSLQRAHQKVIEEAPAPNLPQAARDEMHRCAVRLGREAGYCNAGTVEFLFDRENRFYLLEVNSRLQVEHPVTEAITGLDLVELQLEIAAGRDLLKDPVPLPPIDRVGSAIEARLCAEIPEEAFLPSTGRIEALSLPCAARIDSGFAAGDTITHYYDSLLAKVIEHAPSREAARERLLGVLEGGFVSGVRTNVDLLSALLKSERFVSANHSVEYAETLVPALGLSPAGREEIAIAAVVASLLGERGGNLYLRRPFRLFGSYAFSRTLEIRGTEIEIRGSVSPAGKCRVETDGSLTEVDGICGEISENGIHHIRYTVAGEPYMAAIQRIEREIWIGMRWGHFVAREVRDKLRVRDESREGHGDELRAPLPGKIARVLLKVSEEVDRQQPILVLESMKMEHPVVAPRRGVIKTLHVQEGESVRAGQLLVSLTEQ